jgi:hypothetical protein
MFSFNYKVDGHCSKVTKIFRYSSKSKVSAAECYVHDAFHALSSNGFKQNKMLCHAGAHKDL